MVTIRAFDEIIDFITSAPQPEQIVSYKPSLAAQKRIEELLYRKQNSQLSASETHELEQFVMVEHLMRLAKARAKQRLSK
jgi:hypothetical protein